MSKIKLTKNELRTQQTKLNQLLKYLPTLQLKKALLQAEVTEARLELTTFKKEFLEKNEVKINEKMDKEFDQLAKEDVGETSL